MDGRPHPDHCGGVFSFPLSVKQKTHPAPGPHPPPLPLIIGAVFFIPIYLKNKIHTMPQFLTQRYNETVSMIMAVFWLLLYVVVNLTSILFLGALAVATISGINFWVCMVALAFFAVIITLGGMKVIGYTDVIQVFFLIMGGLATTYLALNLVSEQK